MQLRFTGQAELIGETGNFQVLAFVGDLPLHCLVERAAITAGLDDGYTSDTQLRQLFATRSRELESIASQLFFNGEHSPVIRRQHMFG